MTTKLIPSPSRTYVVPIYIPGTNYMEKQFRKFVLPEGLANTCDVATQYAYSKDLFICGESAYPFEMHNDIAEL